MSYHRMLFWVMAVAMVTSAAVCDDWPMSGFDQAQTSYNPVKVGLPLVLKWQHAIAGRDNSKQWRLPIVPNAQPYSDTNTATIASGICYFSFGPVLYAVDTSTGSLKWRYPKENNLGASIRTAPLVYGGSVYFGAGNGKLYSLKAATGQMNWNYDTRGAIRCSPIITDTGTLLVGGDDRTIRAFEPATGDPAWPEPFQITDDPGGGLASGSGIVIVSCLDGQVFGISLGNGRERWRTRLPYTPTNTSPVILGELALVPSGNTISAYTVRSGRPKWTITLPESDVAGAPACAGNDLYVVANDGKVYSYVLGPKAPKQKWVNSGIGQRSRSAPIVSGDKVFVVGSQGLIVALSAKNGSLLWCYNAISEVHDTKVDPAMIKSPLVSADGSIYLVSTDGVLSCFEHGFPDAEPPLAIGFYPPNKSSIPGVTPMDFRAVVYDLGSGIDASKTELLLDGVPVTHQYDSGKSLISYTIKASTDAKQVPGMPDGKHAMTIRATDYCGNILNTTWEFNVDSTMPSPSMGQPTLPKVKPEVSTPQPNRPPGGFIPGGPGGDLPPPPPGGMGGPAPGVPGF